MKTRLLIIATVLVIFGWDMAKAQFTGGSGRGDHMALLMFMEDEFTAEIPGPNEGWRMLGVPVAGPTYGEFLNNIWTQGYAGANYPNGARNVYYYNEATGWAWPSNATNIIGSNQNVGFNNAGHGIMVHVFADDNYNGTPDPWPKELSVTGIPHSGDVDLTLSRTADHGWHILSNPYPFTVSWGDIFSDLDPAHIHGNIYVWDANRDGEADYRNTADAGHPDDGWSGDIPPFQGFWVRAQEDAAAFGFREAHEWDDPGADPDIFNVQEVVLARLALSGEGFKAGSTLIFDDDKALYPETYNAYRLTSMNADYLHLFTASATDGTAWQVRHLPRHGSFTKTLPLHVHSTFGGQFTLEAATLQGLEGIELQLTDHQTGQQMHIVPGFSYTFTKEGSHVMQKQEDMPLEERLKDGPVVVLGGHTQEARFSLTVTVNYTSTETENDLPREVRLSQNYPNPFNPTTQIQYALPEAADVRLDVYNVMGQRVATLVSAHQNAGHHTATFDGSRLSSGVYIYRLQAGNVVHTRKMLLVK